MTQLNKVLYTGRTHTTHGREDGVSHSDDGRLDVTLSHFDTPGVGTNPEQLFAAGWSACFLSSIKLVARKRKVALPDEIAINAEVDLGTTVDSFGLAARLNVRLPGMDRQAAEALVDEAHGVCAYSNATRGNINVETNVITSS